MTFVVCRAGGLQVVGESVPLVAGGGEGGALDAALEFAAMIDALARRVENAAQAEDEVTAP